MKMRQEAFVRIGIMLVLIVNQLLIIFGVSPLDLDEELMFQVFSSVALVISTLWTAWKDNNITDKRIEKEERLLNVEEDE